ncbi:efflux RND transporter periplasmic adaptor subunit [bacterium]|nr:efflux RND transporter periplasmic adaptor subunit [bacterium]
MKTNIKLIIGIITIAALMSACGSSSPKEKEEHGEQEEAGHGEEGIVSLTEQQMDAIGLKIVQIEKKTLNIAVTASGSLEMAPQDKADVSPIVGGIVKSIKVFEGDIVRKGQVLATLEHPDFIQLQQDYINTINSLAYLEKEYERQKKLYEEKVGSGKDFQKTSADYFNSKSNAEALKAKLNMIGINSSEVAGGKIFPVVNLKAPINGIVSLVETNVGSYIEPLTKVFEIVNNEKVHADLMVFEKDMDKIKVGQKIYFSTTGVHGKELEAKIFAISPAFEQNPKAIHVHANITTKDAKLLPGMYIKGKIIANDVETDVLPEHAIVTEEGKTYIFVQKEGKEHDHGHSKEEQSSDEHAHQSDKDEHHEGHEEAKLGFEMVEVITGATSNGYTEVKLLKPLPENAQIAGNGAYYILAEMGKGETEHSH